MKFKQDLIQFIGGYTMCNITLYEIFKNYQHLLIAAFITIITQLFLKYIDYKIKNYKK